MSQGISALNSGTEGGSASGKPLPIVSPEVTGDEELVRELQAILASRQLTNGFRVREFEVAAAHYLGVPHCVAVSSCTSGLLLTLRALNLRGEVIVPSFTFHATVHSIVWNGLTPIFADCDECTFCVDRDDIAEKVSSRTAAVLAVHMFGCPAPVNTLQELCDRRGIPLIFDAAHGFGSKVGARLVGTFGTAEIFSFSPTKLLVAGEGGLIATRNARLAELLRAARNYGDTGNSDPGLLGFNARMSEFHAAFGLAGFAGLERRIERRNQIRDIYVRRLQSVPGITFQQVPSGCRSTWKDMSILVDERECGICRDSLREFLSQRNIEARRYFWPPVHRQGLYRGIWDGRALPVTDRVSNSILNLPVYSSLADPDVHRVCDTIVRAVEMARHSRESASRAKSHAEPATCFPTSVRQTPETMA